MNNKKQGKVITLRLNDSLKEHLVKFANSDDRSVSATIRRAIREYITKRSTEIPDDI